MLEAALFAGLASLGLVVGYLISIYRAPSHAYVGMAMGFGSGILLAVVTYALVLDTVETSGRPFVVGLGVAAGALVFYFGDRMIAQRFGEGGGLGLALGAVLDGIPESLVIGISVAAFGEASVPLVIGAFIANMAESIGATPSLIEGGISAAKTRTIWLVIVAASIVSAMIGYEVLANLSKNNGALFNGFAGGAVLMVLANALIPEGYERAGRVAGLLVVCGFAIGFALEHLH